MLTTEMKVPHGMVILRTDLVASKDDIVEWDGNPWRIVFDASENKLVYNDEVFNPVYTTNQKTGILNIGMGPDWLLSVEGPSQTVSAFKFQTANYFYGQDYLQWNLYSINDICCLGVVKVEQKVHGDL